jgi:glycosyltransferase involved in cell wall biosynthesis
MQLSVVIITYNEARNVGRCLASVQLVANEIVVLDSATLSDLLEL